MVCCAAAAGSCGSSITDPALHGTPGVQIVAGVVTDTIFAQSELVLEVRDTAGLLVRNTAIRVDPTFNATLTHPLGLVNTDDRGQLAVGIWRQGRAADALVDVRLPSVGIVQTLHIGVLPGAPMSVLAGPRDTTLYTGGTSHIRVQVFDRNLNLRPDTGQVIEVSPGLAFTGGGVRATTALGREWAVVRFGTSTDTFRVSVVPRGEVAFTSAKFTDPDYSGQYMVVRSQLDGSGYQPVLRGGPSQPQTMVSLRWSPGGDHLIGQVPDGGFRSTLVRLGLSGDVTQLFPQNATDLVGGPAYGADTAWVYYARSRNGAPNYRDIYRIHRDGTGSERLSDSLPSAGADDDFSPAPSPQGRYVAYLSGRDRSFAGGRLGDGYLRVLDLQTGIVVKLLLEAYGASWSPDGQWIAFRGGDYGIWIVHGDGTGLRRISLVSSFGDWTSWSPDSKWVIAPGYGACFLLGVNQSINLPLAFTAGLLNPAWRPVP